MDSTSWIVISRPTTKLEYDILRCNLNGTDPEECNLNTLLTSIWIFLWRITRQKKFQRNLLCTHFLFLSFYTRVSVPCVYISSVIWWRNLSITDREERNLNTLSTTVRNFFTRRDKFQSPPLCTYFLPHLFSIRVLLFLPLRNKDVLENNSTRSYRKRRRIYIEYSKQWNSKNWIPRKHLIRYIVSKA